MRHKLVSTDAWIASEIEQNLALAELSEVFNSESQKPAPRYYAQGMFVYDRARANAPVCTVHGLTENEVCMQSELIAAALNEQP